MNHRLAAFALALAVGFGLPATAATTVVRVVSPGGIEAWLVEDHSIPIVSMEMLFNTGGAMDPPGSEGLSRLGASSIDEAAGELDNQTLQGRMEDLAAGISFTAGLDTISGSFKSVKDRLEPSAELLRLILTQPRFEPADVERVRRQLLISVAREQQDPNATATRTWYRAAFGDHPYARGSRGTPESLAKPTPDDLKAWARQRLTKDALIVGVAGDLSPTELGALLDKVFGALPQTAPRPTIPDVVPSTTADVILVPKPIPQSVVLFGEPGIKRDDPDYYAATVVNYILGGGGFTSRLTEEVREKRGLAYSIYSSLANQDHAALLMGSTGTENAKVAQSLELIRAEWAKMGKDGPTAEEMVNAKTYLTGSFPLQLDSTGRIASMLVAMQDDHLGLDYLDRRNKLIEAVTPADAIRVAKRLFDPAKLLVVVVGSPADLKATRDTPPGG